MLPLDVDSVPDMAAELYASASAPERFGEALGAVSRWLDADLFHLIRWNESSDAYDLSLRSPLLDATVDGPYRSYYAAIDPRRPIGATAEVGEVRACHWYFDDRFVSRNEFYQDYAVKQHGTRWIMGAPLHRGEGNVVYFSFNMFADRDHFSLRQIAGLRYLMPTLQRAYLLMDRVEGLERNLRAADAALDAWSTGVVALDPKGRVLWHNTAARSWFGPDRLFIVRAGRLLGVGAGAARLQRALADGMVQPTHWTARPRVAGWFGKADRVALTLTRAPEAGGSPPHLLLLGQPLRTANSVSAQALRAWFGLTPAQARIAALLARGLDAKSVAEACGVSMPTVRTQIRQILDRCDARSLQDLQRLLARLPDA